MDILEIAEEAYYERQTEMERERQEQREKDDEREERDCGICDIAEDVYDYVKNRF